MDGVGHCSETATLRTDKGANVMMQKRIDLRILVIIIIAWFAACPFPEAEAATLSVPSQHTTIASAIAAALPGDTILVSSGTYNENLLVEKNIEIKSVSGYASTIIDGQAKGSVVVFWNAKFDGVRVPKISGFTITNGKSIEGQGGGVTVAASDATVENNRIYNNHANVDGGGILVSLGSNGVIRNNIIDSNGATRFGGGMFIVGNSNPPVYNNQISNNIVTGPLYTNGGASGGAMFIDDNSSPQIVKNTITSNHADFSGGGITLRANCSAIIEDNTITSNQSSIGGGIHVETEGGSPKIKNNTISGNQAVVLASFPGTGYGGGIAVYNASRPTIAGNSINNNFASAGGAGIVVSENAVATITGNKIFSNTTSISPTSNGYAGGGIYVADSSASITNNVIYGNTACLGGGIGLIDNANVTIQNNTIVGNMAPLDPNRPSGGGIFVRNGTGHAVTYARISNNIITRNQDYQIFEEYKKALINYNLINNDGRGIYVNWTVGGVTGIATLNSSTNINADYNISTSLLAEGFVNASSSDYHLTASSGAIDKGESSILKKYDIEHTPRPSGSYPDLGAYEYSASPLVTFPMYRFWSDLNHHHFYTIEKSERNYVLGVAYPQEWKYEGALFRAFKTSNCHGSTVYRFWGVVSQGHFYTISEAEKNYVAGFPEWQLEGPVYCADISATADNINLYRFWSNSFMGHFYTANEDEKNSLIANYSDIWTYEGAVYRVYEE